MIYKKTKIFDNIPGKIEQNRSNQHQTDSIHSPRVLNIVNNLQINKPVIRFKSAPPTTFLVSNEDSN